MDHKSGGPYGQQQQPENGITLSIFMEGTANPMDAVTTQIALFSRLCTAKPLSTQQVGLPNVPGHYKLSFEGCGVSHGLRGTIFANGLKEQCELVKQYVGGFLAARQVVKINFVGLSRGGIGGLYLAQTLADFDRDVVLNMLLFDPVPGNFVLMARFLDLAGIMNANQCMDVSQCRNLGHVVVLYPHEPLPALAVHAPVLPKFPQGCRLELDVILGCHQGALWLRPSVDTCLAFALIRDFLVEHGSQLDISRGAATALNVIDEQLAEMLAQELAVDAPTDRCTHSAKHEVTIVRHPRGVFMNRSHENLLRRIAERQSRQQVPGVPGGPGVPQYMLDFV